ncbi:MAG: DUF1775 domain-containing protein [Phycisphaerales bacterium]|nr:DUF1775 domain-containing protein [Phycisphaerales bacterium]
MTTTFARLCIAAVITAISPSAAYAHITIAPNQSMAGATEKYVLRVPSEGKVATVAAELEIPDGVVVETVAVPNGWKHEIKRQGDRIVAIAWTMHIPAGEFAEFAFVARNPRDKTEVVWTLRQRFADGTVSDWTKGPNGIRPTSMTKLAPRPAQ